jgi:molybdopterin synthase sulfur carrier subunit
MQVKIRYFAWVRERTGIAEETVDVPASAVTIADVVSWLKSRGPEFEAAFAKPDVVRAAINQVHVKPATPIAGAREIAFFPPVTGG